MSPEAFTLTVALAAFLISGVIKGAMGIGQVTVAVAILGTALNLREAVPLLIVPALAANVWQVARGGRLGPLMRRFGWMNAMGCAGIWLGTWILFAVDPLALSAVLGLVVCAYAAMNLTAFRVRVAPGREPLLSPILGLLSGILTGASGSLHLALVPYFQALGLGKDDFIRATGLAFLIGSAFWAAALIERGALDGRAGLLSAAALIPTFLGIAAGTWLRGRVSEPRFRVVVFAALILLGLNLIRKGVIGG